jgi:ADP-heptose:LPS heptosyltransferase
MTKNKAPGKILILRFSSIGDIVLTTPVIRCVKQQTGAELHFLTKKQFAPVLEPNPYLDRLWTFDQDLDSLLPALKQENFDYIVDLHHNLRSFRIKTYLNKHSSSFNKLNLEKWLLVHTGVNLLPDQHIIQRYMDTVAPLGVQYDGAGMDYVIPVQDFVDMNQLAANAAGRTFVSFVIGATHATKRLPEDRMAELCRRIQHPIVLLGGKAEAELGARLARAAGPGITNACGRLNLHQSASVLQQSALVLTHDTGLMHIAAALGKRILSVWGNTVPAFGMYPFYRNGLSANTSFEVKGLRCRPCSKIGYTQCPKGHFRCMRDLPLDDIVQEINKEMGG